MAIADRRQFLTGAGALLGGAALASTPLIGGQFSPASAAISYTPMPSRGRNGTFDNKSNLVFTDKYGVRSLYHLRASHLANKRTTKPIPLFVHLHGDGGYEFKNPNTFTSPLYTNVAKEFGGVHVIPRTPDTRSYTWWAKESSARWLAEFIKFEMKYYNIDQKQIFISGFSGGAEVLAYNFVPQFHSMLYGGVGFMLGGGGADGVRFNGTPSVQTKNNFLMRWYVGSLDDGRNTLDDFDALRASRTGVNKYSSAGWNAHRTLIPGKDHIGSQLSGPPAFREMVAGYRSIRGITV